VGRQIKGAPATFIYLCALGGTTVVLAWLGHRSGSSIILDASSNLRRLTISPGEALFSSAFWLANGFKELASWLILLPAVAAPVERRLGTGKTVITFAVGHIGATLASQAFVAVAVATRLAAASWENAPDVGASYGFLAVAAVLFGMVPSRWRIVYGAGLLGWVVLISHVLHPDFTTVGHGIALLIGLGLGRALRRHLATAEKPREAQRVA
jgi:hypothetical protein